MITDKLENIYLYTNIPDYAADFIKNLSKDTTEGKYKLSATDYANIETYITKKISDAEFEAHNNYIDIQIILSGCENIYYTDRAKLTEISPYNTEKDIVFYGENVETGNCLTLDGSNFAMIFPHEAHAPQAACTNSAVNVKKAVIKIKA